MFVFILFYFFTFDCHTNQNHTVCKVDGYELLCTQPNLPQCPTSDCAEPSTHSIIRGTSLSLHQCQEVRMFWKMADVPIDAPERKLYEC